MPPWDLPARRQLVLLACVAVVACSVELAPEEKDPGFTGIGGTVSGGAAGNGSEGGVIGGGSGGAQGGSGGSSGAGGFPTGGTGAGGVIGGAGGGFGGIGAGGGGTGGGPPPFACDLASLGSSDCLFPDPSLCICSGCSNRFGCEGDPPYFFPDCVCPECQGHPICNTCPAPNGLCDPWEENCSCLDCFDHFLCN